MSNRILADWLDGFLDYTDNSEPPEQFRLWVGISTIAAALQRKCVLRWGPLNFYPNMYIVLVAPSGKARKGTAMGPGKNFLSRLAVPMAAESITREALVREIQKSADTTIDVNGVMTHHSSITVFAPELTVFLGYQNQQLIMDLTDWYDCGHGPDGRWTYRTKLSGTDEIVGLWVNLIGATTPSLIKSTLSADAIGGGLTSRIIFIYEEDKGKHVPVPLLTKAQLELEEKLYQDLERIHLLHGEFKVTRPYVELWTDWYNAQDSNGYAQDSRLAPYMERRPNHIKKLAMICNVSRTNDMIVTDVDLTRSIKILDYAERKMHRTFDGVGKSEHAAVMTSIMQDIGNAKIISLGKLQEKYYYDADAKTLSIIITTLEQMNFLRREITVDGTFIHHVPRNRQEELNEYRN